MSSFFRLGLLLTLCLADPPPPRVSGIPDHCPPVPLLDVLPGRGWDSLRDQDMAQVVHVSYSDCKTTRDGRYLIPNNMEAIPIKSSDIDLSTELIEHWVNYTSLTSRKMDAQMQLDLESLEIPVKIKPFFSPGYEETKRQMVEERAVLVRSSLRYVMYAVRVRPSASLDPLLEKSIRTAAAALRDNDTDRAACILGFVTRDYGTHFMTSVDAGALFLEKNYVDESWFRSQHVSESFLTSLATLSFIEFFRLSLSFNSSVGRSSMQNYQRHRVKKTLQTVGGPMFDMRMTVDDWRAKVDENLVAIDRSGEFISHIATPFRFPDVDSKILSKIYHILNEITKNFVARNTRPGCMVLGAKNFDYTANVEGPCQHELVNETFGGVYLTCETFDLSSVAGDPCAEVTGLNPLTGESSCPLGFTDTALHKWLKTLSKSTYDCNETCKGWWIFKRCHTECHVTEHKSRARMESRWCAPSHGTAADWGYLVGGLYSNKVPNPVTRSYTCPSGFMALRITPNAWVCVGHNSPSNVKSSMEFGGFFTCSSRNPSSNNGTRASLTCLPSHKRFLLTVDNQCQINYCAKVRINTRHFKDAPVVRPPFRNISSSSRNHDDFECKFGHEL